MTKNARLRTCHAVVSGLLGAIIFEVAGWPGVWVLISGFLMGGFLHPRYNTLAGRGWGALAAVEWDQAQQRRVWGMVRQMSTVFCS